MNLSNSYLKAGFRLFQRGLISFQKDKHFASYIVFFAVLFLILTGNTLHESYPDEFDNILGGWNILHGNFLYTSFFTHHGPVAYVLAALVELFSGNSFLRFRLVYSIFLFSYLVFTYIYYRKKFEFTNSRFYILFLLLLGIGATYFWGHMLLADNISAYFLVPAMGILILNRIEGKNLNPLDLGFVSIATFFSVLSSLTYLYLILFIYLFTLIEYFSSNALSYRNLKNYLKPGLYFGIPFVLFVIVLLLTGSFYDYYYQNFVFNQQYYIYNYPRAEGETFINPIRFAIIIAYTFLTSFSELLIQAKNLNFDFPFNISLAVANLVFLIYLFIKKEFRLVLLYLLILIYSNGRSNPLTSSERDYQSAVYIVMSLFATALILYKLFDELKSNDEYRKRLIFSVLFVGVFVFSFANFLFLGRKFLYKVYDKYMGKAPLIYDRPQIAPIINTVLTPSDYTWIGPFEFEELFYTKVKNASQYQIFNPGMGMSERIHQGLIDDFEETKPKLIWFDKKFYILGRNPEMYGQKFISYIDSHYTTLQKYSSEGKRYVSVKPIEQKTDIETKLYIRKENQTEIIQKLLDYGIIKEVPVF